MIRHNHMAIWVLVFFNFLLTILWYSPLMFYRLWSGELGFNVPGYRPKDNLPYVSVVVSYIALMYMLSWLVQMLKKDTFKKGLQFGALIFFGFAVPLVVARYKLVNISNMVLLIDLGLTLLLLLLSSAVLAAWKKQLSQE